MHDVFKARKKQLEQCAPVFAPVPGQTGLLALLDGRGVGLDLLSHADAYAKMHPRRLQSYLLEALLGPGNRPVKKDAGAARKAAGFVRSAAACKESAVPSVGCGTALRFQRSGLAGA